MLATSELIRETAQLARLKELYPRWLEVPLYRARMGEVRPQFSQLPLLTKRDMREGFPRNFLSSDAELKSLLDRNLVDLEHTSGTSEERTPVLFRRGWWDEQEERALRLNAFVARVLDENPGARRATITTPACNGKSCPVVWQSIAQRSIGSTRFVNLARIPFVLSRAELDRMAGEIIDWSPQFLDVSPVHGVRFALHCEQYGIRLPSLRFILCSYEFVSVAHRRILERVFGVPVFNLYGSTETGHLLMEDEHGDLRPSYGTAFLEVVDPDERGVGGLAVTTLSNDLMPLVRYGIGDLVERHEEPYRTTYRVHGRSRDTLRRSDGSRITTLDVDECFREVSGIAHYELRQLADGGCKLRFIADAEGPTGAAMNGLVSKLKSLLGSRGRIVAEPVHLLPPTQSGKFRLTVSSGRNLALGPERGGAESQPQQLD
jgi:phenylacetate-CoA ligase